MASDLFQSASSLTSLLLLRRGFNVWAQRAKLDLRRSGIILLGPAGKQQHNILEKTLPLQGY